MESIIIINDVKKISLYVCMYNKFNTSSNYQQLLQSASIAPSVLYVYIGVLVISNMYNIDHHDVGGHTVKTLLEDEALTGSYIVSSL